jgi:hypothetical protein
LERSAISAKGCALDEVDELAMQVVAPLSRSHDAPEEPTWTQGRGVSSLAVSGEEFTVQAEDLIANPWEWDTKGARSSQGVPSKLRARGKMPFPHDREGAPLRVAYQESELSIGSAGGRHRWAVHDFEGDCGASDTLTRSGIKCCASKGARTRLWVLRFRLVAASLTCEKKGPPQENNGRDTGDKAHVPDQRRVGHPGQGLMKWGSRDFLHPAAERWHPQLKRVASLEDVPTQGCPGQPHVNETFPVRDAGVDVVAVDKDDVRGGKPVHAREACVTDDDEIAVPVVGFDAVDRHRGDGGGCDL